MLIGEAAAAVGLVEPDGLDACIVVFRDGRPVNATLRDCADVDMDAYDDIYVAGGLFAEGTIERRRGREFANLREIVWLQIDLDLTDWSDVPRPVLETFSDEELRDLWERQLIDCQEVFTHIGLPVQRIDYTGYGLCAYIYVAKHERGEVAALRDLHKAIVERINRVSGRTVADAQVVDAGTRITRLVPCPNTKGAQPRLARTVWRVPGETDIATLRRVVGDRREPPRRMIPDHGKALSEDDEAAIVEAVRPSWAAGQRHRIALAIAGMCAKAGVPEEQAARIVDALVAGGEEPWDRARAVASSYARVRSGLDVRGFMSLRECLPVDAATFVDERLERVRRATVGRLRVGGKPIGGQRTPESGQGESTAEYDAPPALAFHGIARRYVDLMAPTTEAPDAFHLGAFLTLVGSMIGRRVRMRYSGDPLYANLYTVLIGVSGSSRKDTAIKRALALPQLQVPPRIVAVPFAVARDVSSGEGLVTMLKEYPHTLLYLTELSALIKNARRKSTTTILDRLIEAWDTPHVLQNLNKQTPTTAINPYLSIIAATQPKRLAAEMTDEDIHSGFAGRWLYIVGTGKTPMADPPQVDPAIGWRLYLDIHDAIHHYADGAELALDATARERWHVWYEREGRGHGLDEEQDTMRIRHAVLMRKVALIYAVTDSADAIEDRHLAAAMALIEWMWKHVKAMLREWGIGIESQIEVRVVNALRKHGALPKRRIQMVTASRRWSAKDFAMVLRAMLENGQVIADPTGLIALPDDEEE